MQLFVRGLQACTRTCEVEPCCSVAELKQRIEEVEGVPSSWQGLVWRGRQLLDERSLQSYGIDAHSTVHLVLRLRGGKGGFGALLRGLGRDGSKTTNDDAMRDLQGRRLRHSNAEAKLKEWEAKAKERELEKIAMQHIKQQERQARRELEQKVEVDTIVAAQKATVAGVQDAVQSALAAARKKAPGSSNGSGGAPAGAAAAAAGAAAGGGGSSAGPALPGKRAAAVAAGPAAAGGKAAGPAAKRSKMMAALETFGSDEGESESSSDDDDEEA